MHVEVNGTRLWFDVDGPSLVPDGAGMLARPTIVLVHGGPGSYDHSYFKPHFEQLRDTAQVVYLDLRDHGRSGRQDPRDWTFDGCADDVRTFCDALGIERPVVLGHSMGGFVVMRYGARHPGHAGGLILLSTMGRFDLDRLVEGVRAAAGDEVAELARRDYGGDSVSDEEWARVFAAFGPNVPDAETLARRTRNMEVAEVGMALMRRFDTLEDLARVSSPTMVVVGDLDQVTPVAAAQEIVEALAPGIGRLAVIYGAGHFAWLDQPKATVDVIERFVRDTARRAP